jgi:hypothetical protein
LTVVGVAFGQCEGAAEKTFTQCCARGDDLAVVRQRALVLMAANSRARVRRAPTRRPRSADRPTLSDPLAPPGAAVGRRRHCLFSGFFLAIAVRGERWSLAIYISSQISARTFLWPALLIDLGLCLIVAGLVWHFNPTGERSHPVSFQKLAFFWVNVDDDLFQIGVVPMFFRVFV